MAIRQYPATMRCRVFFITSKWRNETVSVASKLKEYRKRAGMTQRELAQQFGCKQQNINSLERGVYQPTVTTLARLAKVLHLSTQEIGELVEEAAVDLP
jgi:putative transcriptional regulator